MTCHKLVKFQPPSHATGSHARSHDSSHTIKVLLAEHQAAVEMRRIAFSWLRWVSIAVVAAILIIAAIRASSPRLHSRSGQALQSFPGNADASHLFRRAARCDWSTAGSDTPNPTQCQTYVRNGKAIYCMMNARNGVKQSEYQDFDALHENGWTETHDKLASAEEFRTETTGLETAFQKLRISSNYDQWVNLEQTHSENVPAGSTDSTATILPKLRQWSDVHGLCLQDYATVEEEQPEKLREIKHGFSYAISGQDMEDAIAMVLEVDEASDLRPWPGHKFTPNYPDPNKFYALLGASNVRGFGWLLATHKEDLGIKTIKAITIFNCPAVTASSGTFDQYCIYIEIGDA
ncbi:uncharacterized protein MYCFIDRAFT_194524 [Pseudocercospora fijiensis CIRAD86]|uniref:Uncharacterized protein n=1 Tax=Pseudocercospora fijiensis (strain CIRAD86) TaxID=383855 RepID=M3APD2_PSEFD|nr:uncharacterized protein MYCFIDRAFT_194524 [Pseudocercospora fijiensis CIRAD86]EME86471.1 hypothetical protein MYCFIDRAFT_194524 [Pseudocercospora fijiensis CIRAD86]